MGFAIKYTSNLFFILLFASFLFGAGVFGGVNSIKLLIFIVIQFLGILVPGLLIVNKVGINLKNSVSRVFSGYAIGYAFITIVYAVMLFINIHHASPYVLCFICALSLVAIARERIFIKPLLEKTEDNGFLMFVFILLCFIGLLVYQIPFRSALQIGYQDMYFDSTYWFKNCVASTIGYPLPELSVSGNNLYWHLFSCFNIALFHFSTGIEIYDFCFCLSYVWEIFLLLGGVYILCNEYLNKKKYVYICIIMLLFCSGIDIITCVYYIEHLYGTTLGVVDGLALSLFAFVFLFKSRKEGKFNIKLLIIAIFLYVAAVGSKVPNGIMVLIGAGAWLLYDIIKERKLNWSLVTIVVIYAFLFLIISKVFVVDGNALVSETSSHRLTLNFSTIIRPSVFHKLYEILAGIGMGKYLPVLVLVIPYMLCTNIIGPFIFIVLIFVFCNRNNIKYKDFDELKVSLLLISLSGLTIFLCMNHPGFSQVYFLFAIFPFVTLLTFLIIEKYGDKYFEKYKKIVYGLMFLSIMYNVATARSQFMLNGKYCVNQNQVSDNGTSVSRNEILGLKWARENLPKDAILVTNKVLAPELGRNSFITSAYSERQVYFEGYVSTNLPNNHITSDRLGLIQSYYGGNMDAKRSLINEGVDYAVVFKNISDFDTTRETVLYENNEMKIIKL